MILYFYYHKSNRSYVKRKIYINTYTFIVNSKSNLNFEILLYYIKTELTEEKQLESYIMNNVKSVKQ